MVNTESLTEYFVDLHVVVALVKFYNTKGLPNLDMQLSIILFIYPCPTFLVNNLILFHFLLIVKPLGCCCHRIE